MKRKKYFFTPIILQWGASIFFKPLFYFFLRLHIEGIENLKNINTKNGVLFVSNHISHFDPAIIPISLPLFSKLRPLFYVSRPHKSYEFHEPGDFILRSFLTESWGSFEYVPGKKDYAVSLQNHVRILRDGGSVCIFPEGGISENGEIGEAHGGVGYLAHHVGSVIIPVKIIGIHNIAIKEFFTRKRNAHIIFGKPFILEEDRDADSKKIAQNILDIVKSMR